jgi:hypothetical protein
MLPRIPWIQVRIRRHPNWIRHSALTDLLHVSDQSRKYDGL